MTMLTRSQMRRLRIGGLLAVVVVVVALTAATAQAASGNVTCTGEIVSTKITGNVVVPAEAYCALYGDTVEGNVSVAEGAFFLAISTSMHRNLSTEGAIAVELLFDEVDGNSSFDSTSGDLYVCGEDFSVCVGDTNNPGIPNANPSGKTTKFGNVSITNTSSGEVIYGGNYVVGDLTCYGNTDGVTNAGASNTVLGQEYGQCVGL